MHVRRATPADLEAFAAMRRQLHPGSDPIELDGESALLLRPDTTEIPFVAEQEDGTLAGFATVAVRSYAEGCDGPTPCLEGILTTPGQRRSGVAAALLRAVQDWARDQGFSCLASDALLDNLTSQSWHQAVGFEEVERSVHYRKPLG